MASNKLLFSFLPFLVFFLHFGQGSSAVHFHPLKLFVFGDSYVDTGNIHVNASSARNFPYGITFPGVPSGRFSDGRVLTDFLAKYVGLKKSPIPFTVWQRFGRKGAKYGMNFGFGGTGRIYKLGVKKVVVLGLGPVGCYPKPTAPSFKKCNKTMDSIAVFHNTLLKQAVEKLNYETKEGSPNFFILNMYDTVLSIIKNKENRKGGATFKTPLKPCCFGVNSNFSCGSVDERGNKMYTLCKRPDLALFWDAVHPTQNGWFATFSSFKSTLKHII
ncbi:GDSL esterase/lipase [Cucumis melo var. makuwa]|uniref:GDSL esterase/lipase n=1 Tax=Cucumis melo var. makuwa TaxID=1194695 RepID=A0A5A7SGK1_CUCMM|nr:GDSL esterase/lipase [Cucumis melo var. makuwa]TYK07398.1 GDSL esterase/lipase [Cucumis melo var. makuwa]